MEYPIFAPPAELAAKSPREWSKSEAEAYYEWFLQNFDVRVNNLLSFLGLDGELAPDVLLRDADSKLKELLDQDKQFSTALPNGKNLTSKGYALAADWGLLLAKLLLTEGQGKISWAILKKPKSDQSYNLPVLQGFGKIHLDPIAGSIADAASILRGNQKKNVSLKAFQFWLAKVS